MYEQGFKIKKLVISILILLILIVFTFVFYLRGYSAEDLLMALTNAEYAYLLGGLGMMVLFIVCEAINIYLIFKAMGYKISFKRCLEYSNIGFYFSAITPSASGGQPFQIYYMKQDKIPVSISSVTIFFIVYVYQIAMILVGVIMALLRSEEAFRFIHKLSYLFLFGIIVNTGAIFIFFALMFSKRLVPFLVTQILKAGKKLRLIKDADAVSDKFDQSLQSYREKALLLKTKPVLFFKVLIVTMIQLIALNLIPFLVYCSMGMGYETSRMMDMVTCQSLLTISISAVPLPGAEGVSQGGFLQVFQTYFPQKLLTYAMLIHRFISFYIPLVITFILYIVTHLRITKQTVRGDYLGRKQN